MKNLHNLCRVLLAITVVSLFFANNDAYCDAPPQTSDDIKKIDRTVSQMNERLNHLEGTVSQMNERLNHLGDEIMQIRGDMKSMENSLRSDMNNMENSLRSDMYTNFRWTLAIIFGSWITIIGTFVAFFLALFNKLNDHKKSL